MRFDKKRILPTFVHKVTVLNKLKAEDTVEHRDKWYATVIENCFFKQKELRDANGNVIGTDGAYVCRIPIQEKFLPYSEWKKGPEGRITFSPGDYVLKGELSEGDVIDVTVTQVYHKYRPDIFEIQAFSVDTYIPHAEHYKLEGV